MTHNASLETTLNLDNEDKTFSGISELDSDLKFFI